MFGRKLPGLLSAAGLVLGLFVASPVNAAAANEYDCHGGPIPPGVYNSIDVSGFCLVLGPVTVNHDVTVQGTGVLGALFGAGQLTVYGNLKVQPGGAAGVGCEPEHFPCFDSPTGITNDYIAGSVLADHAVLLLFHHDTIGKNVEQHGGGGGLTCASLPGFGPNGPPPYSTYEDNLIGGNASVSDLRTCWVGFFGNHVGGNVEWHNNQTLDPDGNELASNTIAGNLDCSDNTPPPQIGDSITEGRGPNTVAGRQTGQCPAVVIAD
jgi:hypothetical protein